VSEPYDEWATQRWVPEAPKRPGRTPFERDRARIVHSSALRRLGAKTQVLGPGTDDFARTRLTHSLEVAQVGRELGRALGCDPDVVEAACLAHDLGHPPFGHNGEQALAEFAAPCGGFEGNAQTLRLLTRLEGKAVDADGASVGLNLTRASLDAATKYPWLRRDAAPVPNPKFGAYEDDRPVFGWVRAGAEPLRRCLEAQVMDWSDDVAYCVHDVEDGIVSGAVVPAGVHAPGEWAGLFAVVQETYLPDAGPSELREALERLVGLGYVPRTFDGSRGDLGALKGITSALIGRFCTAVEVATREQHGPGPLTRYHADLVIPRATLAEVALLKGVAAHWVMRTAARRPLLERQRSLLAELAESLLVRAPDGLEPALARDWADAPDDVARRRVVVDQVASLTDTSALAWHALPPR
jgi:dGTPase